MNNTIFLKTARIPVFLLTALLLTTATSYALDLAAVEAEWTPPGSVTPVRMWGFVEDTPTASCPAAPVAWGTGPLQVGTQGGSLSITLRNCLSEPVSLVIPGQPATLNPQSLVGGRITAFTDEVPADGTTRVIYTWNNLKPGTFLYQSGSHPAKQQQMGLYGALTVGSYLDLGVNNEVTLLFSEIDPALHGPVPTSANPLNYKPKYFLINGQTYAPGEPIPEVATGTRTTTLLVRLLNAGLMSHTPALNGPYMKVIAEDGNPYPYPKEQYSVMLAAGKTMDALWEPTENGTYALYDRSMSLSSNGAVGGGMLVHLAVNVTSTFKWIMFIPAITGMGTPVVP